MQEPAKRNYLVYLGEIILNIAIIGLVVLGIRTYLVSPFRVDGESMLSTLEHNEYIIINKLAYITSQPQRGDVAVLRPPTERDKGKYYVKRVIGLPGDEVILRDGLVYIKEAGSPLEYELSEPYLNNQNNGRTYYQFGNTDEKRFLVPDNKYFVMGDNRTGSLDSRAFRDENNQPIPFVPVENLKGKVWLVVFPITKFKIIQPPEYQLEKMD